LPNGLRMACKRIPKTADALVIGHRRERSQRLLGVD
jgi:hypothetical protein